MQISLTHRQKHGRSTRERGKKQKSQTKKQHMLFSFLGWFTSQHRAQCISDMNLLTQCCHTETEAADQLSLSLPVTVCLFVGSLTSQQHASVSYRRICTDNYTCCHTEIEVADQTFYLTQSQYTDTGPTSPSADPIMPGARQGSH